ncbi:MAG: hypothetical protein WEB19_01960 [Acidimicrobiia bacterium]
MERWRRSAIACAAFAVALALTACSGGGGSDTERAPDTVPEGAAQPVAASCQSFRGAFEARTSTGPVAPGLLVDAVAGGVGCLDRVEFTFRSLGNNTVTGQGLAPGYTVEYAESNQFIDGGVSISIDGSAWLLVTMKPASSYELPVEGAPPNAKRAPTYLGNLLLRWTEFNHLEVVRRLEDVDDTVQWVIGLDSKRPFVVDAARDPTRISVWIG